MNKDGVRQTTNVIGALFQILAGPLGMLVYGVNVGEVSNANSTLVVPSGYAFAIWGPIFALCLAYAVYQALPSNRSNLLLRRVGWFTAGAFVLNGVWSLVFPARAFLLAQGMIVGVFLLAGAALLLISRVNREHGTSAAERWFVVLPVGLLFGWITAATFVGFATTLAGIGVLNGGFGEAALGAGILLIGGLTATAVIRAARNSPWQGIVAYAAAVVWALVAVVMNQYGASFLTTGAAVVAIVPVALALFGTFRSEPSHRSSSGSTRPRVA